MSKYMIRGETLTGIADAIRAKTGSAEAIAVGEMAASIGRIESGERDDETLKGLIDGSLTSISLPDGLTKIRTHAFYYKRISIPYFPDSLMEIGSFAFMQSFQGEYVYEATTLPDALTYIGASAFKQCTSLALTELPAALTYIGTSAFEYCTSLAITTLPPGISEILTSTFKDCRALTKFIIPKGVENVAFTAFSNCTGLTEVTFEGVPTTVARDAFSNCTNLLLINVPWSEGEVANAPWGATNATINYDYAPTIFEEIITVGAYDDDYVGHLGTFSGDFGVEIEDQGSYKMFVNGVKYEAYGINDGTWISVVVEELADDMWISLEISETGEKVCVYGYNTPPESTEGLPESITLNIRITA